MKAYLLALLLSPVAPEFTAQVYSRGSVLVPPNVAIVPIIVTSVCYTNKDFENTDHYQVVNEVRSLISGLSQEFKVEPLLTLKPGFDRPVPKPCQNISSRVTKLTLRTKDMENFFSFTYDQITREVPNRSFRRGFGSDSPYTYAVVEIPWSDLTEEARDKTEADARARAIKDAVKRIDSYVRGLGFMGEMEVLEIIDSDQIIQNDQSKKYLLGKEFSDAGRATFPDLDITALLRVRFRFVGASRVRFTEALESEQ